MSLTSNLVNEILKEDEGLIDSTGSFKSALDLLSTQVGGPFHLTKHVEQMPEGSL